MASIQFLDGSLALISIPLDLLDSFIGPILQLIALIGLPGNDADGVPRRPFAFAFPFTNISVTPQEVSIACPRHLANAYFLPITSRLLPQVAKRVTISRDDYIVIALGGADMDAGQRVLDVTAPLAIAGINLFYITSYYSDYVLVAQKARSAVVNALEEQGFVFQTIPGGQSQMTNTSSPLLAHRSFATPSSPVHERSSSSSGAGFFGSTGSGGSGDNTSPILPPATSIADWQERTFANLGKAGVLPVLDARLKLVSAAGHRSDRNTQARLNSYVTACLISSPPPRFLSLTLTDTDSMSLTLDRDLLPKFAGNDPHGDAGGVLLTSDEVTVPIMLDFGRLPDESTGIVCGVAGRLLDRMAAGRAAGQQPNGAAGFVGGGFSMSYLSTVKGGNVIVREDEVDDALEALRAFRNEDNAT